MNCAKCRMPILYGVASYGGPHCMCHTKPNYDHNALADLLKERDQLKVENERLRKVTHVALPTNTMEQAFSAYHRRGFEAGIKQGQAENDRLKAENERLRAVPMKYKRMEYNAKLQAENDTLLKQINEARELLTKYGYSTGDIDGRVDAWLEANKP